MRKKLISSFVGLLLVGMGTHGTAQETGGWQVGGALPYAQNGLSDWTNNTVWGLCLDAAYIFPISGTRSLMRPGFALDWFPGSEKDRRTISLVDIQLFTDAVVPVRETPFSVVVGMSANTWYKSVSGVSRYPQTVNGVVQPAYTRSNSFSGMVQKPFGKIGFRLGVEYAINDQWTATALFQIVDLGTDTEFLAKENRVNTNAAGQVISEVLAHTGKHTVGPSWIQYGVRYKF